MSEVGPQIRRLRKAKGWTVAQLAVYAGMSPSAVSQIETGRRSPTAASLEKLAEALEVGVVDLFPKGQPRLPDLFGESREHAKRLLEAMSSEDLAIVFAQDPELADALLRLHELVGEFLSAGPPRRITRAAYEERTAAAQEHSRQLIAESKENLENMLERLRAVEHGELTAEEALQELTGAHT